MEHIADRAGLSGFTELFQSCKKPIRFLFWVICLTAMTSFCVYSTTAAISNYVSSPTVTSVTMKNPNEGLPLPEMLLCYKGGWNGRRMKRFNFSNGLSEYLMQSYTSKLKMLSPDLEQKGEFLRRLKLYNITIKQFYYDISYTCEEIVESRVLSGDLVEDKCENVSQQIFEPYFPDSCLLFKHTGTQSWPSAIGGVSMTLKKLKDPAVQVSKSIKGFEIEFASTFTTSGQYNRISLPANFHTTISLKSTRYTRVKKYGLCVDAERGATLGSCKMHCWIREFYNVCNCIMIAHQVYDNQSICSIFDFSGCLTNYKRKIRKNMMNCITTCRPPCEEWEFDVTSTSKPLDFEDGQNDTLAIAQVGYNNLKYTEIAEVEAFSVDMIVGNVGGIISLYLGGSFVTLFQLIYYTVLYFAEKRQAKRPS